MPIKAGVAFQDITPEGDVVLFGHPQLRREAAHIHDPLQVGALHIRTGAGGLLIISLDLYALEPYTCTQIYEAVEQATGLRKERIFLGCTNTHSGPATVWPYAWKEDPAVAKPDSAYVENVKQATVRAASSACATTRPVKFISTTVSHADLTGNGHTQTDVVALRDVDDGPYAAIALFSTVRPATVDPDCVQVSADFPHVVREQLLEHFGRDQLVILPFTEPCTDQKLSYFSGTDPFERAQVIGQELSRSVIEALEATDWNSLDDDLPIQGMEKRISLPFRALPDIGAARVTLDESRSRIEDVAEEDTAAQWNALCEIARADGVCNLIQQERSGMFDQIRLIYPSAEIRVLKIGNTSLVGFPGNLTPDYASTLKEHTNGNVVVAAFVNGFLQGDIVRPETENQGLFGPMPSPFAAEIAEKMIAAAVTLVNG